MIRVLLIGPVFLIVVALFASRTDGDEIFSGPQPGERLVSFSFCAVLGELEGKEINLIEKAGGSPVVLVFMHKLTRPSAAVARAALNYASKFGEQGMVSGLIFLSDDKTATGAMIKRAAHALPQVPIGISTDGGEGPGAYGLNRKVTLTVLVGSNNKVTANFALVQPSVQADVPKIGRQIALAAGKDKHPTLAQMGVRQRHNGQNGRMQDPKLRSLLSPLIQKTATAEDVKRAAEKIEAYAAERPLVRTQIGNIARRIVNAGVLERYGTPTAQQYLRKWAKVFDSPDNKVPKP